jgi:hypothetical protein
VKLHATTFPESHTQAEIGAEIFPATVALHFGAGGGGGRIGALQLDEVPQFVHIQDHAHGPVPVTTVGVPTAQRLAVGAVDTATV